MATDSSSQSNVHPLTHLVASLSKNGAIITNAVGEIEWANPAFCNMTGYSAEELIGKKPGKLLLGTMSDPDTVAYMDRKLKQQQAFTAEIINHGKGGTPYWVSLQYHPVFDGESLTHYVAVAADISRQKETEEALRESEGRFRQLANSAPALIWMTNQHQEYEYFNHAWLEFSGSNSENSGGQIETFLHPEDLEKWRKALRKAVKDRSDFEMEFRVLRDDGTYRTMLNKGTPRWSDNEEYLGHIGTCLDITDIKDAQQELERANTKLADSENKLNAFFNSTTDTNFLLGPAPKYPVLAFNKTAANVIKGLFHQDLEVGDSFLDYTVDDVKPKFYIDMEKAMSGETVTEERRVEYDPGVVVYWNATYQPAYDEKDNIIGVAFNVTNIDAQRKYEIALEEKNRLLEEIAHLQSHEIRRPVATLLGLISLLNPESFSDENRSLVELVHNTVHEMDNIIHRVVELTYETEQIKPFNPSDHDTGRTKL